MRIQLRLWQPHGLFIRVWPRERFVTQYRGVLSLRSRLATSETWVATLCGANWPERSLEQQKERHKTLKKRPPEVIRNVTYKCFTIIINRWAGEGRTSILDALGYMRIWPSFVSCYLFSSFFRGFFNGSILTWSVPDSDYGATIQLSMCLSAMLMQISQIPTAFSCYDALS